VHLLEVENLTKRFGGLTAVNNVSFHIDEGEIVGLIGPNGAGKTTMFNLITGFLKADSGTVKLRGENILGLAPHKIVNKGLARTQGIRQDRMDQNPPTKSTRAVGRCRPFRDDDGTS